MKITATTTLLLILISSLALSMPAQTVNIKINKGTEKHPEIICIDPDPGDNYWSETYDWKEKYGDWTIIDFLNKGYKTYTKCQITKPNLMTENGSPLVVTAGFIQEPEKIAAINTAQNKSYESRKIETKLEKPYKIKATLKQDGTIEINNITNQKQPGGILGGITPTALLIIIPLLAILLEIGAAILYTRKRQKPSKAQIAGTIIIANLTTFTLILLLPTLLSSIIIPLTTLLMPLPLIAIPIEAIVIHLMNRETLKPLKSFLLSLVINITSLLLIHLPILLIIILNTSYG